jgi:nucleoside-diphosphate-sugar epimerase
LILLDRDPGDDPEVIAADLSNPDEGWIEYFQGVDTVVHLVGSPDESATWEELEGPNLDALFHVGHAAALAGVERFVFASSLRTIAGYRDHGVGPITVELPPRPDGPCGASRLVGERFGKSLAQMFDITFVALRLGNVQRGENRPETLTDDWARSLWLSNGDLVRVFTRAVEAELDPGDFIVLFGLSNNRGMRWKLSEAAEWLGYVPDDDAWR